MGNPARSHRGEHTPSSQNPLAEPRRIHSLDAARAIAALLVVCEHELEKMFPFFAKGIGVLNLGQAGVVCFFLISGFVIPYSLQSHGSLLKYAIARIFRIFPLYWFVLFLTVLLLWLKVPALGLDAGYSLSPKVLLAHMLMIQSLFKMENLVSISWTLVIEIIFYFITAFVFLMKPASLPRLILISCALVLGASVLAWHFHKSLPVYPVALILTAFAGQAVEYHWSGKITKLKAALIFVAVLLTSLASIYLRESVNHYSFHGPAVAVSWTVGYALFLIFLASHYAAKVLGLLGRISYSIYLLHPIFIALFFFYLTPSWTAFFAAIAATCVASMATFTFIEQPGIDFGKRLFKKILLARSSPA